MRSRDTRQLAEEALIRLARAFGDRSGDVVVIGGLNADLLTDAPMVPHQGTVDVDLLIEVGFVYERDELDLGWLERGLRAAGFTPPRVGDSTWRWQVLIDGTPVTVDLLCDTADSRGQQIVLPGCPVATALNVAGPAAAAPGVSRELSAGAGDKPVTLRFASLGGYLLAKAAAVVGRTADKDLYDLAFVLLHNREGGPTAAALAAYAALPDPAISDHAGDLRGALGLLASEGTRGPRIYAEQRIRDGEDAPSDVLMQDAIGAALECRAEFERCLATRSAHR